MAPVKLIFAALNKNTSGARPLPATAPDPPELPPAALVGSVPAVIVPPLMFTVAPCAAKMLPPIPAPPPPPVVLFVPVAPLPP